jgi:TrmH family RNA methyltransferase
LILVSSTVITSLSNDKVKYVRALTMRKHRVTAGRLVIEGARLIDDALAANVRPDWILRAERLSSRAQETLRRARSAGIEVFEASESVLKACSDTASPQGLLAVVPFPRLAWPRDPGLVVIADTLRDPGNLGTLLRSAAAAGVDGMVLAPGTVDVYNPKVVRGAMGAHFRLPILEADWKVIADRVRGMNIYLAAAGSERAYTEINWTNPTALIIGGEAEGASPAAVKLTTIRLSIPLERGVESLNAAVAASVLLFEAKRQRDLKRG